MLGTGFTRPIAFEPETVQHIRDNQELFGLEFDEVDADELGVVTGAAMLKDETRCIRCGLVRHALSRGHDHHGVVQPASRRADGTDFSGVDRRGITEVVTGRQSWGA